MDEGVGLASEVTGETDSTAVQETMSMVYGSDECDCLCVSVGVLLLSPVINPSLSLTMNISLEVLQDTLFLFFSHN